MGIESMISSLPQLIGMLPLMLESMRVLFFIFFIWFFGNMSMRGFRGHKPLFISLTGIVLAGSLCLLGASAFAGFLPFLSGGIFSMLQIDILAAGVLVSITLAVSIHLITHGKPVWRPDEMADLMKRKVVSLEEMLKNKAHHITEADAKKIAESVVKGYKAVTARMIGNEYEVAMKKGDKEGKVIIDAWDGEVKSKIQHESKFVLFFRDPHKVIGLVIIMVLTASSIMFFEGFRDPAEDMASMFGMSADDMGDLVSSLKDSPLMSQDVPEGCVSPLIFSTYSSQMQDSDFLLDHVYEDDATERVVEENSGDDVRMMLMIDHDGKDVIMAFTAENMFCYLTDGQFCMCMNLADMND